MRLTTTLAALAMVTLSCGGAEEPAEQPRAAHHAGGHHAGGHHAGGHHAGGHHGGHDHSSPEALRPLMRDLFARMRALRDALDAGDVASTQREARAIAVACDDQDVHAVDPERFGPRFAEIDEELHAAAAQMADVAESGDLEAARDGYAGLHSACVRCHAQAPTAQEVNLSPLAPTEPTE